MKAISAYLTSQQIEFPQGIVRLDGQYGNGGLVGDLAGWGLGWVMRGKDYQLLDLPEVQARLAAPPAGQTTHPETGMQRTLYDCPDLLITATGQRSKMFRTRQPVSLAEFTPSLSIVDSQEKIRYVAPRNPLSGSEGRSSRRAKTRCKTVKRGCPS